MPAPPLHPIPLVLSRKDVLLLQQIAREAAEPDLECLGWCRRALQGDPEALSWLRAELVAAREDEIAERRAALGVVTPP